MVQVDVSHPTSHGSNHHFDESGKEIRSPREVARAVWDRHDGGGTTDAAAAAADGDGVSGIFDAQKDSLFKHPGV
jgi:hypothetical protein